jgi:hypothetical protein
VPPGEPGSWLESAGRRFFRPNGVLPQISDPCRRFAYPPLELVGRVFWTGAEQLGPLGLQPNFGQETADGSNPHFGPQVPLSESALALGTRHHAEAASSTFDGGKQVLGVDLAAAGDFANRYVYVTILPLSRKPTPGRGAIRAEIDEHVWIDRLSHCLFPKRIPGARHDRPGKQFLYRDEPTII